MRLSKAQCAADRSPERGGGAERHAMGDGVDGESSDRAGSCCASGTDAELLERCRAEEVKSPLTIHDRKITRLHILHPESVQFQQILDATLLALPHELPEPLHFGG